ncbi:hypothetical protein C8R45DRAFT_1075106 [Mycena sanguinolenta]|nr:hypothetical protein C8R45DRAFT_1075106 [Mycena sanguinolenta]
MSVLLPAQCSEIPREELLFGPSAPIWAKHEGRNLGLAFGGNKTRKLEYFLADALAQSCYMLVSIGGVQSNHTAAVGSEDGLKAKLLEVLQELRMNWHEAVHNKVPTLSSNRRLINCHSGPSVDRYCTRRDGKENCAHRAMF